MPLKSSSLAALARTALDTLLPPRCPGTGEIVDRPGMVSAAFWPQLSFIERPFCETCGLPFALDVPAGSLCGACLEHEPFFDRARSAVIYNDASRKLVLDFKYGDKLHAVHAFIPWLTRAGAEMLAGCDLIVPVPLHRARLWRRRFNQSALIAAALAKTSAAPHLPDALLRLRATVPQKGLSKKDRAENVKGAFGVNPKRDVAGKNILLVDDVFTSGATLNECARVLKKAGAAGVFVLTVARVTLEEF